MKRVLPLLFAALLCGTATKAQEVAAGYIITKANDTLACTILLPESRRGALNEGKLSDWVRIIDSTEKQRQYIPSHLAGFGFKYEGRMHHYRPRTVSGTAYFLRVLVEGSRITCYQYYKRPKSNGLNRYGYGMPNPAVGAGGQKFYVLEDGERHILVLDGVNYIDRTRKLKAFFAGKPEQLALYEATVKEFADVPYFAVVLNAK